MEEDGDGGGEGRQGAGDGADRSVWGPHCDKATSCLEKLAAFLLEYWSLQCPNWGRIAGLNGWSEGGGLPESIPFSYTEQKLRLFLAVWLLMPPALHLLHLLVLPGRNMNYAGSKRHPWLCNARHFKTTLPQFIFKALATERYLSSSHTSGSSPSRAVQWCGLI